MLKRVILCIGLAGLCLGARAAILPPEKLLPRDTLLVVTLPDSQAAWSLWTNAPYGRLWNDPQFKPFRDKFMDKFDSGLIGPLEKNLGIKVSDYSGLARGQATFAILPVPQGEKETRYAKIFLLDTKDKAALLRTNLADVNKKWAAAGKPMKMQQIRGIDFTTLFLAPGDLSLDKLTRPAGAAAPPLADEEVSDKATNKTELTFGQSDSLLLVSDSPAAIEKVLTRQGGGLLPALEEQSWFQKDFGARLHGAPFYAWFNIKDYIAAAAKTSTDRDDGASGGSGPNPMIEASGLGGITSASVTYRAAPEGITAQVFLGVPESARRGFFKALTAETKDANPPPFVPADATKFWRWRLNIPHSWTQIESMLNEFSPQYASVINFVLQSAGKDKDEKYDLKSELMGSLGDDIIHYEKAPTGNTLAELNNAPSIYLIGSPNPDKLAAALKNGLRFMGTMKEREFLGRQICTMTTAAQENLPSRSFSFAGSGGYVALSDNTAILEEYLRSDENKAKPLGDTPGLADAAQKVGGMGTGWFGFENQSLSMKAIMETLRLQPITLQDILGASPMMGSVNSGDEVAKLREWTDFTLLPPFDAISQYFYFSVYAGAFSPDGFTLNYFSPTPPKLR